MTKGEVHTLQLEYCRWGLLWNEARKILLKLNLHTLISLRKIKNYVYTHTNMNGMLTNDFSINTTSGNNLTSINW